MAAALPLGNGLEAMRWLAFGVSPMAAFSTLSQDSFLAWTKALIGSTRPVSGTTMGTPSVVHTSSAHDRSWPPLGIAPVGAHRAVLLRALQESMDGKVKPGGSPGCERDIAEVTASYEGWLRKAPRWPTCCGATCRTGRICWRPCSRPAPCATTSTT